MNSQYRFSDRRTRELNKLRDSEYTSMFNGCLFKMSFPSRRIARGRARKSGMRPYKCSHCKRWHLTRQGTNER